MSRKQRLFEAKGMAAFPELHTINARLDAIKSNIAAGPPLTHDKLLPHLADMRERILRVYAAEMDAVEALQKVIK